MKVYSLQPLDPPLQISPRVASQGDWLVSWWRKHIKTSWAWPSTGLFSQLTSLNHWSWHHDTYYILLSSILDTSSPQLVSLVESRWLTWWCDTGSYPWRIWASGHHAILKLQLLHSFTCNKNWPRIWQETLAWITSMTNPFFLPRMVTFLLVCYSLKVRSPQNSGRSYSLNLNRTFAVWWLRQ